MRDKDKHYTTYIALVNQLFRLQKFFHVWNFLKNCPIQGKSEAYYAQPQRSVAVFVLVFPLHSFAYPKGKDIRLRIYGEESESHRMAMISHYLHNTDLLSVDDRRIAVEYIKDYIHSIEPDASDEHTHMVCENPFQSSLFIDLFDVPFPEPEKPSFTFIDLFAGIGGIRIPFTELNGKCVFSSEWDKAAQKTYTSNFGENVFYPSVWHENKSGNISVLPYACALRTGASYNYLLINGYRRPSSRELLRFQGFPDKYNIVVSHAEIRRQTGNSVAVPMIRSVANKIVSLL
ncbi:MAG: DNA cytosine methyltransferase [Bacteroidales bacterium]|nr:DNA cytosine methyltransferase [Bacteroidales bacterium]